MHAVSNNPASRNPHDADRWQRPAACCRRFGFSTPRALLTALRLHGIDALSGFNQRVLLIDTHAVSDWLDSRRRAA